MFKKALQFGAGNIGRGFLGQLFFESGYHTTFAEVVDDVVAGLNERHAYPLRIVDEEPEMLTIGNVSAVKASDIPAVASALAEAELAATAVGVNILPKIAPLIAAGLTKRFSRSKPLPLNIIVCENMINAGPFLREEVRKHLDATYHRALDNQVGFVEASIGRMVPVMSAKDKAEDPLLVCVEAYCELPVDADAFKGPLPELKNMRPYPDFAGYVERKLFVHNAGHAVTGYLGYLCGHEYIWQAINDPRIRAEADAAIAETSKGLTAKHGLDTAALKDHWADLIRRFGNKALGDQVARICKDPVRKLGPKDRLIGAGLMCLEQDIEPHRVAFAAAAAIRYDHPGDAAAAKLQQVRRRHGLEGVLKSICRIPDDSPLGGLIADGDKRLRQEGWIT